MPKRSVCLLSVRNVRHTLRKTSEHCQSPEEDEMSLYGGSDLDDQIERLVDTSHIANANGVAIKDEESDEDELIKDSENDFNWVEQGEIGSNNP